MEIGASIFFTEYSMGPTELAVALEQRGFDSLWVAEHSHMPVTRRFTHPLGEAALTKEYFDVMDPFVTLSAAAAVTTRLKLATAICLVLQRDTLQTAKLVASLDQRSKGRILFGIGCGWNAEEMEDHGTVYETRTLKMREQIEAMKEIWTKDIAEYHGEIVEFPPLQTWPKPVQKPHPTVLGGGKLRHQTLVDTVGIRDDAACQRLSENLRQTHDRHGSGCDDVCQHLPRPNRRQLIDIADKQERRSVRHGAHNRPHQRHVDHRSLIDHEQITIEGCLRVPPEVAVAGIGFE